MTVKILFKRGLSATWTASNPTLSAGEPGFETDTGRFKIGDGITPWAALQYIFDGVNTISVGTVTTAAPGTEVTIENSGTSSNAVFDFTIPQGTDGNTLLSGLVDPTDEGNDGDFYVNLDTKTFFGPKASGVWPAGFSLIGPDGADGNTILSGTVVPTTEGVVGDLYINTVSNIIYGPKTGEGWGTGIQLGNNEAVVTGPETATDTAIAVFDGATGKIIQNSKVTVNTDGVITLPAGGDIRNSLGASVIAPITLPSLTDVIVEDLAVGQVLAYNGSEWVNATVAGTNTSLNGLTDVVAPSPTTGQVLKYNGSQWVAQTDEIAPARLTQSGTTESLANGQTANLSITGVKTYALLKIETSDAAWVRLYTSTAARSADASRSEGVDPTPGSGVIAEVITTGSQVVVISPAAIGFSDEIIPSEVIQCAVTNKSATAQAITVTVTVLQLEA